MTAYEGFDPWVFALFTVAIMGGAACLAGQALAVKWRPAWQAALASLLLGAADRFLVFVLFEGPLASPALYVLDTAVIGTIGLAAWRVTRARRMVEQYPWLYERAGPFSWREKRG